MQMSLRALFVFLVVVFSLEAEAASVTLLSRSIELAIPTGYCALGAHSVDVEILNRAREVQSNENQFLAMFASCTELQEVRMGRRLTLDNYGQILTQAPNGKLRALKGMSRAEFIRGMSSVSGGGKIFADALKQGEARAKQFDPGVSIDSGSLGILSVDSSGIYAGTLASMTNEIGRSQPIIGVF